MFWGIPLMDSEFMTVVGVLVGAPLLLAAIVYFWIRGLEAVHSIHQDWKQQGRSECENPFSDQMCTNTPS